MDVSPLRCHGGFVTRAIDADYLVVGAGAMGMAFTDALIDHSDVRVAMIDRRHGVSGHWLEAYPFVRLHQASAFYGVASNPARRRPAAAARTRGGAAGAGHASEICAYYARILDRMVESGKVEFFPNSEYVGDRTVVSRISGERFEVPERCRIVDAHYLAPSIPAEKPPPFEVSATTRGCCRSTTWRGWRRRRASIVIVGSGKTATDACIWLLSRGVDPDAICWVRPRDPWMMNRAVVQPDPAVFRAWSADTMQAAAESDVTGGAVPPARGRRHHAAHRPHGDADDGQGTDPRYLGARAAAQPGERRTPRAHRSRAAAAGSPSPTDRSSVAEDALVVHCAADGLKYPPPVPVWRRKESRCRRSGPGSHASVRQ